METLVGGRVSVVDRSLTVKLGAGGYSSKSTVIRFGRSSTLCELVMRPYIYESAQNETVLVFIRYVS